MESFLDKYLEFGFKENDVLRVKYVQKDSKTSIIKNEFDEIVDLSTNYYLILNIKEYDICDESKRPFKNHEILSIRKCNNQELELFNKLYSYNIDEFDINYNFNQETLDNIVDSINNLPSATKYTIVNRLKQIKINIK